MPRAVWQGWVLQSLPRLGAQTRTAALEPLVLCLQTHQLRVRMKLVRFSVAGDGGEESRGEKEERQGVG